MKSNLLNHGNDVTGAYLHFFPNCHFTRLFYVYVCIVKTKKPQKRNNHYKVPNGESVLVIFSSVSPLCLSSLSTER